MLFPLAFKVVIENSELVHDLRLSLDEKTQEVEELRRQLNHTEYLYRCQCIMSCEMSDELRAHGIKTRFKKPTY